VTQAGGNVQMRRSANPQTNCGTMPRLMVASLRGWSLQFSSSWLQFRCCRFRVVIAEILAHLVDTEIVVSWRMRLVIGQSGATLQAVDQNTWAQTLDYLRQDPKISLETFRVLRANNLRMLQALPESVWENYGMHSERGKETVAQIVRMYAGHNLNHLAQIGKIARETGSKRRGVG
jgi:hypothetical protein